MLKEKKNKVKTVTVTLFHHADYFPITACPGVCYSFHITLCGNVHVILTAWRCPSVCPPSPLLPGSRRGRSGPRWGWWWAARRSLATDPGDPGLPHIPRPETTRLWPPESTHTEGEREGHRESEIFSDLGVYTVPVFERERGRGSSGWKDHWLRLPPVSFMTSIIEYTSLWWTRGNTVFHHKIQIRLGNPAAKITWHAKREFNGAWRPTGFSALTLKHYQNLCFIS